MLSHLGLFQEQQVRLTITPQLKQSIEVLQLSNQELAAFIEEQGLSNPVMDIVWNSNVSDRSRTKKKKNAETPLDTLSNIVNPKETLEEYVRSQLRLKGIMGPTLHVANYLAGNLKENGYLDIDLNYVSDLLDQPEGLVIEALQIVQSLEPAGIGAQSLQECLLLQIRRDSLAANYAYEVVDQYFQELAYGKFRKITAKLGLKNEEMKTIQQYIRQLNPRPGESFAKDEHGYIVPDAIISKTNHQIAISIQDLNIPVIKLNPEYLMWLKQSISTDAKSYISEKILTAKSLIRSVDQRNQTLFRVITAILEEQPDFLDGGLASLRPLTLKQIADKVSMHESTISRAVGHKYVQTPFGIMELKSFFSSALTTESGGATSAQHVKSAITKLISAEDKQVPFSDQKICDCLQEEGIQISRRTVAKYREELRIPSSGARMKYF
jgi:RNA polymerase sigma-54 factor